jgi:hypothetical protein
MAADYGYAHKRLRARWEGPVERGECVCARCGRQVYPGERWHLDHAEDRQGYLGPVPVSHARCNVRAGAKKGGKVAARKRRPRRISSRIW